MSDSEIDLEPIVQELFAALDGKVSEDTLRNEVKKYIVTYKTGVTIAKESILKRYNNPRQSGTVVSSASVIAINGGSRDTQPVWIIVNSI